MSKRVQELPPTSSGYGWGVWATSAQTAIALVSGRAKREHKIDAKNLTARPTGLLKTSGTATVRYIVRGKA